MGSKCKKISIEDLENVASLLKVYITQDSLGHVEMWRAKPTCIKKEGYWVSSSYDDSINDRSLCLPYMIKDEWYKSLISPKKTV